MELNEFRKQEQEDRNLYWKISEGDRQNLLDEAIEELEDLADLAEEFINITKTPCTIEESERVENNLKDSIIRAKDPKEISMNNNNNNNLPEQLEIGLVEDRTIDIDEYNSKGECLHYAMAQVYWAEDEERSTAMSRAHLFSRSPDILDALEDLLDLTIYEAPQWDFEEQERARELITEIKGG